MRIERAVTVNVEAAHRDANGKLHGHSYLVECWTSAECCLTDFERGMREVAARVDHTVLESSIGASSMEALAQWFLVQDLGDLTGRPPRSRVVVRRPTLGYAVEVRPDA
jgi:6-pyruvoyl-tetrahydropterin synthase